MSIFNKLYNFVFSYGQKVLHPYEVACLYSFGEIITPDAKLIFERQLKQYDRVQRSENGKHLAFFDNNSDDLCQSWPEQMLFPFRSKPCPVAELNIYFPESRVIIKAEIFIFAGRIAGIEFIQSPKKFQDNESIHIPILDLSQYNNFKSMISQARLLKNLMANDIAACNLPSLTA